MQQSPFKFLDSFDREDINEFFGRGKEVKALFKKAFESNLLLLYGLSGTGKTSLVRCGLYNMFADTDWLPLFIRRGQNIISAERFGIELAEPRQDIIEKIIAGIRNERGQVDLVLRTLSNGVYKMRLFCR